MTAVARNLGGLILTAWLLFPGGSPFAAETPDAPDPSLAELRQLIADQADAMAQQKREMNDLRQALEDVRQAANKRLADVASAPEAPDTAARVSHLEEFVGRSKLGGWLDFSYQNTDRHDSRQFFDPQHFYLFWDNRLNEQWQAFGELEIEHSVQHTGTSGSGEFVLDRLYIQFNQSDRARFRVGKFNTRSGLWTPVHWAINVDTIQKPIHEDNAYVPAKQVGAEFFGIVFPRLFGVDSEIRYATWLSNGPESSGTDSPTDNRLGGGADVNILFADMLTLGSSLYTQTEAKIKENTRLFYMNLDLPCGFTVRGETLHQHRGSHAAVHVWYAKVKWQFLENMYLNLRMNFGDDVRRGAGHKQTQWTATLAYWPLPHVRMKFEYVKHDFSARSIENYNQWQGWLGFVL